MAKQSQTPNVVRDMKTDVCERIGVDEHPIAVEVFTDSYDSLGHSNVLAQNSAWLPGEGNHKAAQMAFEYDDPVEFCGDLSNHVIARATREAGEELPGYVKYGIVDSVVEKFGFKMWVAENIAAEQFMNVFPAYELVEPKSKDEVVARESGNIDKVFTGPQKVKVQVKTDVTRIKARDLKNVHLVLEMAPRGGELFTTEIHRGELAEELDGEVGGLVALE